MKSLAVSILILLSLCAPLRAQDSTILRRTEYVIGASLTFSLLDYVGFNLVRNANSSPEWYRLAEGTMQTAISYVLYKTCDISSVVAFNLIWWTWGDDLAYYGWTNLFNPASPNFLNSTRWENRTNSGLQLTQINWAGWTPIGLLRKQGSNIARNALIAQAVVGFSVSMAIDVLKPW